MIRRLLPLVGVLIAISSTGARAQGDPLTITGTNRATGTTCWTGTAETINYQWGGGPIGDCPGDLVQLDITGQILLDAGETLHISSDDGVRVWLDDELYVNSWYPRSCWGDTFTGPVTAGWHTLRIEFFEDYGGACLNLWHMTGNSWEIVPAGRYASVPPPTTTTTTSTTSTSSTTTSTTSTTTTVPETTTTQSLPEPASQATTSTQPIQSTTSFSVPVTTQPPTNLTTAPSTSTTQIPTTSIDAPSINPSTSSTAPLPSESSTTTTVPEARYTPAEALAAALDPVKVANLTPTEAAEVFAAIDEATLTPEQGELLVAAVQNAPPAVRAAFEAKINVYGGATDNYVPLGSTVPVRTRRIIIITTGLLVAMPSVRRSRP